MKFARPLLKLPQEKWPLRQWILSFFPENYEQYTYLEPFGGGADLLFSKNHSQTEIINDESQELVNLFHALRDEPHELIRRMHLTKCCPETFEKLKKRVQFDDYLDQAVHDLLLRKMSRGGLKDKFIKPNNETAWKKSISSLQQYADRIQEVFLLNKDALEVILAFNTPDTLLFCDPPYLHDGKETVSDMDLEKHINLSRLLNNFNGKAILSGTMSPLYKRLYKNWNIAKKKIDKSSKEMEIIWTNF